MYDVKIAGRCGRNSKFAKEEAKKQEEMVRWWMKFPSSRNPEKITFVDMVYVEYSSEVVEKKGLFKPRMDSSRGRYLHYKGNSLYRLGVGVKPVGSAG